MKLPYYRSLAGAVKANLQGGRGGACTSYFSCYDPEIMTLLMLQNPRTTRDRQNRDIHFSFQYNRFFAVKVARNEDIFLFNAKTAPDLYEAFYSADAERFERLYNKYDQDVMFAKTYQSARKILTTAMQQSFDVATLYFMQVDEANRHTSFKEPIYSSNLCAEVFEPTHPYTSMLDLYSDGDVSKIIFMTEQGRVCELKTTAIQLSNGRLINSLDLQKGDKFKYYDYGKESYDEVTVDYVIDRKESPEVALCSLAAIVEPNIPNDEVYSSVCYYALKMIDKCIHMSDYALPHVGFTAKQRLNAGVGLTGIATRMAKLNLKYDTPEGLKRLHQIAERHSYFLIKNSLLLGKELGNAPWIHKTKWAEGWLPIDTYKKAVDELVEPSYRYDWEALRQEIIQNGGIRNSALISHMPCESSSKASGAPNSIYPVRDSSLKKSDASTVLDWCAKDDDIYGDQYQIAWTIKMVDMVKVYAVVQKFTDQGISADLYKDRSVEIDVSTSEMIEVFLAMVKYGMKSRYYQNSLTSSSNQQAARSTEGVQKDTDPIIPNERAECAGGCTL